MENEQNNELATDLAITFDDVTIQKLLEAAKNTPSGESIPSIVATLQNTLVNLN